MGKGIKDTSESNVKTLVPCAQVPWVYKAWSRYSTLTKEYADPPSKSISVPQEVYLAKGADWWPYPRRHWEGQGSRVVNKEKLRNPNGVDVSSTIKSWLPVLITAEGTVRQNSQFLMSTFLRAQVKDLTAPISEWEAFRSRQTQPPTPTHIYTYMLPNVSE